MRRLVLVPVLVLALFAVTACNNPYGIAAKLAQDIAVSVNQADVTVDQIRVQGAISANEERAILGYLSSINTLDGQYIGCVQQAHANTGTIGGFTACVQTLAKGIGDLATLAAIHVTNPASQAKVTAVVQAVVTLVTATVTALNGH